jgi:hypothetical protein
MLNKDHGRVINVIVQSFRGRSLSYVNQSDLSAQQIND